MKIKIDENLPNSLALLLQEQEHDVETVKREGLSGSFIITLKKRKKTMQDISVLYPWEIHNLKKG